MQNGRDLVEMCCSAYESPDESGRGDIGAARHVLTGSFGASNDADKSAEEADEDDNAEGYDYCAYHVQPPIHTHAHTHTRIRTDKHMKACCCSPHLLLLQPASGLLPCVRAVRLSVWQR
jgi:hypothetical protein